MAGFASRIRAPSKLLEPLKHLEWPIVSVLSDKQTGSVPAVATVLPKSRHQFCQAHYLRNLAEPLAELDTTLKAELWKTVRQQVGTLIRQAPRTTPGQVGILSSTGLLPTPLNSPSASQGPLPNRTSNTSKPKADEILSPLFRHTRYLPTLKGRPPFRLAGMETDERLHNVARLSLNLVAERYEPRLAFSTVI